MHTARLATGQQEADVVLMEAGKGEKNELVNFIVIPSPLYETTHGKKLPSIVAAAPGDLPVCAK